MTPRYQTQHDLNREKIVAQRIVEFWGDGYRYEKLPEKFKLDGAILKEHKIVELIEIKCPVQYYSKSQQMNSSYPWHDSYLVSWDKVQQGIRMCSMIHVPTNLYIGYIDGNYWITFDDILSECKVYWSGRKDRPEREPYYFIPKTLMKELGE